MTEQSISQGKILLTLGGGGYENEAKMLLRQLGSDFTYIYVTSKDAAWYRPELPYPGKWHVLPTLITISEPSRFKMFFNLLKALVISGYIILRERPNIIVGVATPLSVPLLLWGRITGACCIFVESITRTHSLSHTGRLIKALKLSNRIYVQWPGLAEKYPGVNYSGSVL